MKFRILMILCLALILAALGCDKGAPADGDQAAPEAEEPVAGEPAEDEQAAEDEATADEEQDDEALAQVKVAEEGTPFDPAVQPEQLPAGVWYCDMGTSHWAAARKPEDGKCPECGMKLKQHDPEELAARKKKAIEADEHGDHAHEGGEQGHGEEDHDHDHDQDKHAGHEH